MQYRAANVQGVACLCLMCVCLCVWFVKWANIGTYLPYLPSYQHRPSSPEVNNAMKWTTIGPSSAVSLRSSLIRHALSFSVPPRDWPSVSLAWHSGQLVRKSLQAGEGGREGGREGEGGRERERERERGGGGAGPAPFKSWGTGLFYTGDQKE